MTLPSRKIGARAALIALCAAAALLCACGQTGSQIRASVDPRREPAYHLVRSGDTLESIARGYRVSVDHLARANRLDESDRPEPGRRLLIPDGARIVHTVRRGESLDEIASNYRVRVSTITHANRLGLFPRIAVGDRLVLPREAVLPHHEAVAARGPGPAPETRPLARPPDVPAAPVAPPRAGHPDLGRAEALVDRAAADYRAAWFERALDHAQEAESQIARSDDRDARRLGARAAFVKGSAQAALGRDDPAKASFARVHELDPRFEPPKGWLSPRLERLYVEARRP
jgi:LysM repeat protein